jgi:arylformamidase
VTGIYRNMDRAELDAAYSNTDAVAEFPVWMASFRIQSRALYQAVPCTRDIAYGPRPRQRFDWFPAAQAGSPTFVFMHGGYWQNCVKEDFAFIAGGPRQCGFNVVLAEYTLAPEASMTQIVAEIGSLLDHLAADPHRLGTAGYPVCLSGHSAGGHLAAMHRSHALLSHALTISALTDLEPISLGRLNDKLQLSPAEVLACSPLRRIGPGVPTTMMVGARELPELVRQSDEYAAACRAAGEKVASIHVPGHDHFSILQELARPDGSLMKALMASMFAHP